MVSSPMPVLITGATGSIGYRLAQRLSEAGLPVRALVRDPASAGDVGNMPNISIFRGDLRMPESLRGCAEGCSLVFHCAAKLTGSDWAAFRAINVDGTRALLKEAEISGVQRFVHASTIGVYACSEAQNIDEDFPWPQTTSPYFVTKQEAERSVWQAASAVPITVARLGDVYGPGQHAWTIDLLQKIYQGLLVPPTEADSGFFNPVYIDNAIDALVLMGGHPAALGEAFNVVDGTPMPFSQYFRWYLTLAGRRSMALPSVILKMAAAFLMWSDMLRGREAATKPDDVDYILHKGIISGQKIRSLLGWSPSVNREEAFCRTEEWLKSHGHVGGPR